MAGRFSLPEPASGWLLAESTQGDWAEGKPLCYHSCCWLSLDPCIAWLEKGSSSFGTPPISGQLQTVETAAVVGRGMGAEGSRCCWAWRGNGEGGNSFLIQGLFKKSPQLLLRQLGLKEGCDHATAPTLDPSLNREEGGFLILDRKSVTFTSSKTLQLTFSLRFSCSFEP